MTAPERPATFYGRDLQIHVRRRGQILLRTLLDTDFGDGNPHAITETIQCFCIQHCLDNALV